MQQPPLHAQQQSLREQPRGAPSKGPHHGIARLSKDTRLLRSSHHPHPAPCNGVFGLACALSRPKSMSGEHPFSGRSLPTGSMEGVPFSPATEQACCWKNGSPLGAPGKLLVLQWPCNWMFGEPRRRILRRDQRTTARSIRTCPSTVEGEASHGRHLASVRKPRVSPNICDIAAV